MADYITTKAIDVFMALAENRLRQGRGVALLLEGPPGGGKTAFANALAARLGGRCFYYSGSPDKERDLLYEIDVDGVLRRTRGWVPGPAWEAFAASHENPAVLLIDEVDKTAAGFDAFLLRLLEEWAFRAPGGGVIKADPARLAVVLTSNGRRKLRPEVLRRCQRIRVPLPDGARMRQIVTSLAGGNPPAGGVDLLIRLAESIRLADEESAPSPKEIALCVVDAVALDADGVNDPEVWRDVVASHLVRTADPAVLDKAAGFRWARAVRSEFASRGNSLRLVGGGA